MALGFRMTCGAVIVVSLMATCGAAAARSDDVVARYENATHCHRVASRVGGDLEQQGRQSSATLMLFRTVLFDKVRRGIRELHAARVSAGRGEVISARNEDDIRADVDRIQAQGEAALHAELRRCWTLFDDRPVPDDLI